MAALTLELLRVPSPTGQEGALADLVEARVAALGPRVRRARLGQTVVARIEPTPGRPTLGLFGHLDTVAGHLADPVREEGGRIFGCGASDMKGGLAVMLHLLAARAAAEEGAGLVCVFYDGEEGPYAASGLARLLAASFPLLHGLDLAVCLEPTGGEIQVGCLGVLNALVRFTGRAAHSARPWLGENAIHKAAPFLARVAALAPRPVTIQGLTYHEVLSVTTARSHDARNVVPDRFELNVNVRFAPGRTALDARQELLALVAGEGEVEVVDEAPAGPVVLDHPLVERVRRLAGAPVGPKQAWTDVARLGAAGIPAINYGPGEPAQAHRPGEWVAVASLEATAAALARLLEEG
ncbi:MAG TPA: succinyl-diaminopimelate desuccinylase [Thermodesulfobacteriota bacterium]|nr:succinyl-diaminopimelate desuccinylase [Thermodesulfobacteriota bacterium]